MRTLCCVILMLGVSACDQKLGSLLSAQVASDMPVAGKYEGRSHATMMLPGEGVVREADRTDRLCIGEKTPTAAAALIEEMKNFCPEPKVALANGRISGTSVCDIPDHHARNIPVALSGTYDRQSISLLINYSVDQMQVTATRKYRRVGDC